MEILQIYKQSATHKKLQGKAIRIIKLLPNMIHGKQRGSAVSVKLGTSNCF